MPVHDSTNMDDPISLEALIGAALAGQMDSRSKRLAEEIVRLRAEVEELQELCLEPDTDDGADSR